MVIREEWQCRGNDDGLVMKGNPQFDGISATFVFGHVARLKWSLKVRWRTDLTIFDD
jgi:hypothetical protein